jgi:hypothetical protein
MERLGPLVETNPPNRASETVGMAFKPVVFHQRTSTRKAPLARLRAIPEFPRK